MKVCAFDVETEGLEGKFVSGATFSDRGGLVTEDLGVLIADLKTHAARGYQLMAHNAEYDLCHALWAAREDVTLHYYNRVFHRARWRCGPGKKSTEVWDTLHWAGGLSLKDLGKVFGLPKWDLPQRLQGIDPDRFRWVCDQHQVGECVPCYNLRDAEITYRFASSFVAFMEQYGLTPARTLGANAVRLWQHFDPGKGQALKSRLILDLARTAYHGGRCEVFRPGAHALVYTYDIRSQHGALMRDVRMPDCRTLTYVERPSTTRWQEAEGVVEATVFVPQQHLPVLPVEASDGQVYFGVGTLRGCWVIAELRAAVQRGAVVQQVHRVAYTTCTVDAFPMFSRGLLALRAQLEEAQDPREFIIKRLLNALPGRLGVRADQTMQRYERITRPLIREDLRRRQVAWVGEQGYLIGESRVKMRSQVSNVLWAATISAYGRLQLLAQMEQAGESLIYCDADSVFSSLPMVTGGKEPGALRDTGYYTSGRFWGPKLYRLEREGQGELAVARGVPKQLALEFLAQGHVSFPATYSLWSAIEAGKPPASWYTLSRTLPLLPTRRVVLDPKALLASQGCSATVPVSFWLGADGISAGSNAV